MSTSRVRSGQIIDLGHWVDALSVEANSRTVVKADGFELSRLALPAGRRMPLDGWAELEGASLVHCLSGTLVLHLVESDRRDATMTTEMSAGQLIWLEGGTRHAVESVEDAVVLWTVVHSATADRRGGSPR